MILITGLAGTSGIPFYHILCREHYKNKIRVVVRPTTDISIFENSNLDLELVIGDINNIDFMCKAMEGCDTVFHIARKDCSVKIIEAVKKSEQVKNVILVSSTIVYSNHYKRMTLKEDEKEIVSFLKGANIRYCFIRPTMIFGTPYDGNISRFIRWFNRFSVFPIVKKGTANIQPVSRYDVAEGYWLILKNFGNLKDTDYIVSGKDKMTLAEMFDILVKACGKKTVFINIPFFIAKAATLTVYYLSFKKIDYREKLDRLTEDRAYSHQKIAQELGYAPKAFADWVDLLVKEMGIR